MKNFTKRLLSVVISVLIVLSVMPTAFASAAEAWKFSKTEVTVGEEFVMTFDLPETVLASSLGLHILFDNTVFEITNIAHANYADMQPYLPGCNQNANVAISWCDPTFDANTTIEAGTELLNVTFKVKDGAALGENTFEIYDWNVTGVFNEETFMPEDITPAIPSRTQVITVVEDVPEVAAAPVITENPESVEIYEGETANLDVIAESTDGGELSYQWYKDGVAIEGAIAPDLAVFEAGIYKVVVTNTLGETTATAESTEATVTVLLKADVPVINEIGDVTVIEGEPATLTAVASANGDLTYEWYFGGEVISPEAEITVYEAGEYTVVVTNTLNGTTASASVTVNVIVEEAPVQEDADANNVLLGKSYEHNVTTFNGTGKGDMAVVLTDGIKGGDWYGADYFNAKQANVSITFDMWYAREIKELYMEFLPQAGAGIHLPTYLEIYAINGEEETLIYDGKTPVAKLTLVADQAVAAEKLRFDMVSDGAYNFIKEVAAYVEPTGTAANAEFGPIDQLVNYVEGMTYTIEGVDKWYNSNTNDSAATKLTDGVINWGTSYNSVYNYGSQSSTTPVITFNFDEVKDIAEIDIYAIFGKDGIGAPPAVIEYADANGNWIKVADITALEHKNFLVAKEVIKATALRFTFTKGFCFLGEIQVFDRVTNMAATGNLVDNKNLLLGEDYTHNVTDWYNANTTDTADTKYLTDGDNFVGWSTSGYFGSYQNTAPVVTFEFDEAVSFAETKIYFINQSSYGVHPATGVCIEIDEDGTGNWKRIYDGALGVATFSANSADDSFTAKAIRYSFTQYNAYCFISEIELYKYATVSEPTGTLAVVPDAVAPTVVIGDGAEEITIADGYLSLVANAATTDAGTLSYQWYKDEVAVSTGSFYTMFGGATEGTYKVVVTNTLGSSTATAEASVVVKFDDTKENIAIGKSYEWVTGMWASYPDTDNVELTDNVYSDWKYYSNAAYAGAANPEIILDLGKEEEIFRVATLFMSSGNAGLALPSYAKYQYSTDKETWYDFGSEWTNGDTTPAALIITDANVAEPVTARYIKLNAASSWIFLGEFMVYGNKPAEAVAPVIDTDLEIAKSIYEGESVELSVVASTADEGTLSYQWYKDGEAIEGATDATLTVTEAGLYKVVVTNTLGESTATAESAVCAVTVLEVADAPVITAKPEDAEIFEGEEATLAVVAEADGELSYQWYKDGEAIEGATEATYVTSEAGEYYAVVTNTLNGTTATTETVKVTVTVKVINYVAEANGIKYEKLADAIVAGGEVVLLDNIVATETIKVNGTVTLDLAGFSISQTQSQTKGYSMIENFGNLTIKDTIGDGRISYGDTNGGQNWISNTITNRGTITVLGGIIENTSVDTVGFPYVIDNNTTTSDAYLYVEGGEFYNEAYVTVRLYANSTKYKAYVEINSGHFGSGIEFQNPAASAVNAELVINDAYIGESPNCNAIYMFSGSANADWSNMTVSIKDGTFKDGIKAGWNMDTVQNFNKEIISGGTYIADVSEFCAEGFMSVDNGEGVYVIVEAPSVPVITTEPEDATIIEGDVAELTVVASANGELSYQWYKDGEAIEGATEATYETSEAGEYYAVVTNTLNGETATTETVKVTVTVEIPTPEFVAPELKFDAETRVLTAVKNSVATVKVGVAYIGDATFEVGVDNWNEFVELGKAYPDANGASGYAVYSDFTERSFKTVGNYVAFAKYTNDEGATVSDYYVFTIEAAAEEIAAPYFTVEGNALTLVNDEDATIVNVGAAYVGDTAFDAENADWDAFVAAGQTQTAYNGEAGYATYGADFTGKTFQKSGNYAAFVKYLDTYGNTQVAYYGFEIASGETEYTLTWVQETRKFTMITEAEDFQYRMGVAYIGDNTFDFENPDWDTFVALGKQNPAMNSSMGYVLYVNECPAKEYKTPGNYAAFVKYVDAYGNTVVDYYEFNIPKFIAPELDFADNTLSLVMNEGQPPVKVGVAYVGTDAEFDPKTMAWDEFVAMGQAQSAMNGSTGYVTYNFNESGAVRTYRTLGNYAAFVKYTNTITGSVISDYFAFTVA